MPHPIFRNGKTPLVLGHRGVPAVHQENSLAGFRRAVELGLGGVELDVFACADGRVVVFHDEQTERLTGKPGCICDLRWDDICKLQLQSQIDMGGRLQRFEAPEPIPLLEQVLDEFKDKLILNIELKAYGVVPARRHTGTLVGKLIREAKAESRVFCTSFDPLMLYCLQRENPDVHMGFAWDDDFTGGLEKLTKKARTKLFGARENGENFIQQTLPNLLMERVMGRLLHTRVVGMEHTLIDDDSVQKAKRRGLATGAYTLFPLDTRFSRTPYSEEGEVRTLERLVHQGVDWIETDQPERVQELLAKS